MQLPGRGLFMDGFMVVVPEALRFGKDPLQHVIVTDPAFK
jgi:hypothetical protein